MSYFKADVRKARNSAIPDTEKFPGSLPGTLARPESDRNSSRTPSSRATQESRLIDDIKHQVIANHIYQAQCGALWIRDATQQDEGVMVRKQRHHYMFKPPGLADSPFAEAMNLLNVQVSIF